MSGLNCVQLIGRLGADPEIRRTNDGRPIANFNLATSETWRDKSSGERKERTEWHRVVIFNEALTKIAEQYLKKGDQVYIQGSLATRKWEKDGVERYSTEVVLKAFDSKIVLLGGKGGGTGRPTPSEEDYGSMRNGDKPYKAPQSLGERYKNGTMEDLDDEIPF